MLHLVTALALVARTLTTPVSDSTEIRRENLMALLRKGGYTVVLRHARTDMSFKEEIATVPVERSKQRNLSDDGIRDAALMGVVFRKYGVTFSEIISSPMYRATETAEMAAGKPTTTMALRVIPSTAEQEALIKKAPKPGTNRLLVTHHPVIETHIPGIKPGDVGESEAAVIRHLPDGKIELVGRISLDDWRYLANPNGPNAAPTAPALQGAATYSPPAAGNGVSVKFPDTHAGRAASDYVAAFNTGSADKMRAFIEGNFVANPARPIEDRLTSFARLFGDLGPMSLVTVDTSEVTHVVLGLTSKKGTARMTLQTSDTQPMRIASISFGYGEPQGHR